MSITVTNVSKYYGRQKALNNVSFSLKTGEVVGFLGPNGAGKSTMMKILTGYFNPSEGRVEVCGIDPAVDSITFRRKIGYLPEHNPLYDDMYITEYLYFVAGIYQLRDVKKRVEDIIELTGLTPERDKKIAFLSKGYRQRVGLAQALLPDPEVLILDEPTSGLDPNQIDGIRDLILNLGQSKTVLLSTHIMQEVKAICERAIIINKGNIVADEPLSMLGESIAHEIAIEAEFDKKADIEKLKAIVGLNSVTYTNNKYFITASEDIRPQIFRFAVDNNLVLMELQLKQQSLESIFRKLTS